MRSCAARLPSSRRAGPGTVDRVSAVLPYLADKDPQHVPGVVITGVVVGIALVWLAIRAMFGKKK